MSEGFDDGAANDTALTRFACCRHVLTTPPLPVQTPSSPKIR
jgi:hypothetical protein